MATTIAEPNDLPSGTITDENAGRFAILVYQQAQDDAGIKTLNIAEWKTFMNYNGFKVDNLASYIGVEDDYNWQANNSNPYTGTAITDRIKNIAEQAGVSTEPVSGVTPLNERIGTLEDYVKNGWVDETVGHLDGLLDRVSDNETNIDSIMEEIGSGGGSSSSLTARITALEGTVGDSTTGLVKDVADINTEIGNDSTSGTIKYDIKQLKDKVGDSTTGLVKDVADLKTTVNDSNTGLVKKVQDITDEIGDESTPGTIKSDIKELQDKADISYKYIGNIEAVNPSTGTTTKLIVDGEQMSISDLKHGDTFNIKSSTEDFIRITLNSQETTYYNGANITWIKKEETDTGYFDELGATVKSKETEEIIDGRFVTITEDIQNWTSRGDNLSGLYAISAISSDADPKPYAFIDYFIDGFSMNSSTPTMIVGNFADCFVKSTQGNVTIKTGVTLSSLSISKLTR